MTRTSRLLTAAALPAVAALLSLAYLGGEAAPAPDRHPVTAPGGSRIVDRAAPADAETDLARSRLEAQPLLTYQPAEGNGLFALQVRPRLDPVPRRPRDLALLVSTTATVAGAPFNSARQLAEAIAEHAAPEDRISLWVVNTPDKKFTRNLTGDFVAPHEKKIQSALEELSRQYPAGDADLKSALRQVLDSFAVAGKQRVILYLGDGLSLHDPIAPAERVALGRELALKQAGFFPVPLGKDQDAANLHGLAAGSGGAVLRVRIFEEKIADVLQRLDQALAAPVLYPRRFRLEGDAEHFPKTLPPLRGDAPTLVVGRYRASKELAWTVEGEVAGRPDRVRLAETLPLPPPEVDNYFLVSMAEQWQKAPEQHAFIQADRALVFACEANRMRLRELLGEAEVSIHDRQLDAAARLFEQAARLAPHDAEARAGLTLVDRIRAGKITPEMLEEHLRRADGNKARVEHGGAVRRLGKEELVQLAQLGGAPNVGRDAQPGVAPLERDDLLQAQRDRIVVEEQKVRQNVEGVLRKARRELAIDPDATHELLRTALLQVRDHPDLGEKVRQDLSAQLENALRDAAIRGRALRDIRAEQQKFLARAQKELTANAQRIADQERTEARFRVYKGLMNLARYEERAMREVTEGMVAMQREAKIRGDAVPLATQAMYDQAQVRFNIQRSEDLKRLREQRFLEVMMAIEKSHVPFPDEPPIHFPALDYWKAITDLRKEKYQVSSLPDDPKGRKQATDLAKLLEEPLNMKDFQVPMKLREALALFSEQITATHPGKELPVLIDTEAFKNDNPDAPDVYDTEVKFPALPKEMAVATALRIALSQIPTKDATYLIRRNYIEVTTNDRVVEEKVLRVYPVGQLVMPINSFGSVMGMRGGMMMGMRGGMMMGGMNMMGMGGGMNMMGMGGGMMMGMGGMNMMGMGGMNMMGMGGFNMGGMMMGGMNMMGIGGGFNMGGMMMGGMMMGGMMRGGMMMGGVGMGGQFPGGFNGNLGFQGATQAVPLITLVTQVVAPGEWFVTPAQQAAMNFQGNFMSNNFMGMGFMGMGFMGMGAFGPMNFMGNFQGPPPPVSQGGPAQLSKANTIQFFPTSLALIVRGSSRVHYKLGGPISSKAKPIEGAAAPGPVRMFAKNQPGKGGFAKVANALDEDNPGKGPHQIARGPDPKRIPGAEAELDPKKVWEDALKQGGGDPGLIIATADFLFENEKYEHAAEFLKADLRLGIVVRPWVYEALALALEASGGSPEEVRRARLSAVALDPRDAGGFLRAAQALGEHKDYQHALAYCRQAAQLTPDEPSPYEDALGYAELSQDPSGMQWAAEKLLGRAWATDNEDLHLKAQAKAEAMTDTLKRKGRTAEAQQLRAALCKLGERDLVIRLTWEPGDSGPADLELEVQEPGGSVCNSRQRQTAGGGVHLGNTLGELTRASYVAAQAFPGEYQVRVRRLWGRPLGSRGRLEVIWHQGLPDEQREFRTVRVEDRAEVTVTLAHGRRTALAAVPALPPPRKTRTAAVSTTGTVLLKLRDIADGDFSGGPQAVVGGMGVSQAARVQPYVPVLTRQSEKLAYQTTLSSVAGDVGLVARAAVSEDRRHLLLSLRPTYLGVASAPVRPVVEVPLIPGR